ncbi:MAG: hypothetical protein RRY15_02465 [Bacteroidales bacterium]
MKTKILFLFCVVTFPFVTEAQIEHVNYKFPDTNKTFNFIFGQKHQDTAMIRILLENAPQNFNAPGAGRFAIVGNQKKFYLSLSGYVKGTLSYDWKNPIVNNHAFITSFIPMDQTPGNEGLVQLGAQTSTLAINFVGLPGTKHQIGAYFNINFSNTNYAPAIINAYATYFGFKIGMAFSLYTDLMAGPPTIDFQGPNSWTLLPNAVLDYEYKFNKHWGVGIGIEMPIASYTTNTMTYAVNQKVPDIPAYVQYSWQNGSSWIRLSGIIRNMQYRDVLAKENHNNVGWGAKLSGSALLFKNLTSFYQIAYGSGASSYFQDLYGMQMDMLPNPHHNGKLANVNSWGAYLGLQYNFTKDIFASCTYSIVQANPTQGYYAGDLYKSAQYVVGNVFWNVNSVIQLGLEYIWGDRQNMDHNYKSNNRIQTMIQVSF